MAWLSRGHQRRPLHGKEGVDGSSPSEGSVKAPLSGAFLLGAICRLSRTLGDGSLYGAFRLKVRSPLPVVPPKAPGSARLRGGSEPNTNEGFRLSIRRIA
jgi:hypothetical protein